MSEQRSMVSGKWVEGLFNRALGPSINTQLSELLKAEGLELSRPFQSAYPREQFVTWVRISARELFPGEEPGAALRLLGAKVVEDLRAAGKMKGPFVMMAKLLGPRRVLRQMADYVQSTSALKLKLEDQGNTAARIELNDGELADFVAGSLESFLAMLGARSPKVEAHQVRPDLSVLSARWA